MIDRCNILIVGGGIAGVALGARLADWGRKVWILEQEEYSPAHASGRAPSAWSPVEARDEDIERLAWAGAALWDEVAGALTPKGALHLFGAGWLKDAAEMWARGIRTVSGIQQLEPWEVAERYPWVKTDAASCSAALWVPAGAAGLIDTARLYSYFRSRFYEHSGRILVSEALLEARYGGGAWTVRTSKGALRADVIVNCAGAWADDVARRCQVRRMGFASTKRSMLSLGLAGVAELPWRDCPFITWHSGSSAVFCNARADARIDISPAGEAEWAGGEAEWSQPEAWQIAEGLQAFESRTSLHLDETRGHSTAWLRASVADGRPVIGWARETPAYFWMAGFGRTGAECALSASALACDMIRNRKDFSWLADRYGLRTSRFAPDRLSYAGVTA